MGKHHQNGYLNCPAVCKVPDTHPLMQGVNSNWPLFKKFDFWEASLTMETTKAYRRSLRVLKGKLLGALTNSVVEIPSLADLFRRGYLTNRFPSNLIQSTGAIACDRVSG